MTTDTTAPLPARFRWSARLEAITAASYGCAPPLPVPESEPAPDTFSRVWPMGTRPKLPRTRRALAIHEAGHVVVARALGLPVHGARIEGQAGGFAMFQAQSLDRVGQPVPSASGPDNAALCLLAIRCARPASPEQNARDLVTMYAAGLQAEILDVGIRWPGMLWTDDADGIEARACLADVFGGVGMGWCQLRARVLLANRWEKVKDIAAVLDAWGEWQPPEQR